MDERTGCDLLARVFREEGIEIARDVPFAEDGISVTLDGYDTKTRIGFEFITTEAGDRAEFTREVVSALEERMKKGAFYLFLVDEVEVPSEEGLERFARMFLGELRRKGALK